MEKGNLNELNQNPQEHMTGMLPPPSYDLATGSNSSPQRIGFTNSAPSAPMPMPMPMPMHTPMQMPIQYAPQSNEQVLPGSMYQPTATQQEPQLLRQVAYFPGSPALGPESTLITCPSCILQQKTRVDHVASTKTHLMALLMCVFGLFCCACIPYCMDSCKNANHYCSNCGAFLGTYNTGNM